jgi:hypothetical protein
MSPPWSRRPAPREHCSGPFAEWAAWSAQRALHPKNGSAIATEDEFEVTPQRQGGRWSLSMLWSTIRQPIPPQPLCDFCGSDIGAPASSIHFPSPVFTVYMGEACGLPIFFTEPGTGWSGCLSCAALIHEDRWDDLKERAITKARARGLRLPFGISERQWVEHLYAALREHLVVETVVH